MVALSVIVVIINQQKIIDRIIPEPLGGAHKNPTEAASTLKKAILEELENLVKLKPEKLLEGRIEKFGALGEYIE